MRDVRVEVLAIHFVYLRSNLQRNARSLRNLDRAIDAFLGCNPPQAGEVSSLLHGAPMQPGGQTVIHGRFPMSRTQRAPLSVRDRHQWDVTELGVQGFQSGNVQATVQSDETRRLQATRHRQLEMLRMKVNDVEFR